MSDENTRPNDATLEFERRATQILRNEGERIGGNAITEFVKYLPGLKLFAVVKISASLAVVGVEGQNAAHEFVAYTQMGVMETGVPFRELYHKTTVGQRVETFRWDDRLVDRYLPQLQAHMVLDDLSDV